VSDDLFTPDDLRQMAALGVGPGEAARQVELFRNPPPFTRVLRPCRPGDGIRRLAAVEHATLVARWEEAARQGRLGKFVPASGAASRMFKPLLSYLAAGARGEPPAEVRTFFDSLPRFAFYGDLAAAMARDGRDLEAARAAGDHAAVLRHLLTSAGLDYAELPKGLIQFHRYPEGARTPFEEHLVETADYARDAHGTCRLHFTVSPQHEAGFRALLEAVRPRCEERFAAQFAVSFSQQQRSTDTVAVDPENRPFRLSDGSLLFRPGGHGALLDNVSGLATSGWDIVLLKNIDNVVPDARKPPVALWNRLLTGLLLALQDRAFQLLERLRVTAPQQLEEGTLLPDAARFLERELARPLPAGYAGSAAEERRRLLVDRLGRPLRTCGLVRNQGEPGGGPFWVESAGEVSPQIVETSQIDPGSPEQQAALAASTHFSPVHVVCALRDHAGRPYDLQRYVDPETVFIAAKSHAGRPLKALEHPGLWNGAMAGWNTVFVEVPDETFAPVKTVLDLLRREHQG
jgi:uncharacterized protein DUF4301